MSPTRLLAGCALVPLMPSDLYAAAAAEGSDLVRMFVLFAIMLLVGKFAGELFDRIRQPAVLGELLAGVVLGGSVLGILPTGPEDPLREVVRVFAEIGVVVLLFEIGLETDLKQLFRVGTAAATVAVVGVVLPLLGGIAFWLSPLGPHELGGAGAGTTAIFLGAALTATSVGITARVLQDLNAMSSTEARLIIGAAVIDDVLGLVLLGVVSTLAAGEAVTALGIARTFATGIGFLVVAVALGLLVAPGVFGVVDRMRVRGVLLVSAFAFLLLLSALAHVSGSAMIIGAFAAGLILSGTNQFDVIEERIKPIADVFTPVFFLSIGAQLDVRYLNPADPGNMPVLMVGAGLLLIAIVGKIAAGWAVPWQRFNRASVGLGMMPRGEVGLIFANIGLTTGVLTPQLFGALLIMVIGTTFLAPPLLKWSFARWGTTGTAATAEPPAVELATPATDPQNEVS